MLELFFYEKMKIVIYIFERLERFTFENSPTPHILNIFRSDVQEF